MSNVNYNKEFAFKKNVFLELIKIAAKGLYNFDELSHLGFKQTQISQLAIRNTINLLIDSGAIVSNDSKFQALPLNEEKLKALIIRKLTKDSVLKVLEDEVEKDDEKRHYINPINLFEKYRGVLALIEYLGLVKYNNTQKVFYLTQAGKKSCCRQKKTLVDLEKDLAAKKVRGMEAENYILLREQERLKNHSKFYEIKKISDDDVAAGYDIQSFQSMSSKTIDKFIEVKSYKDTHTFYWTANEIKGAKISAEKYAVVIVNYNKMNDKKYNPKEIYNPYKFFNMKEILKNNSMSSDLSVTPNIQAELFSFYSTHIW